jgi:hypothetical protein
MCLGGAASTVATAGELSDSSSGIAQDIQQQHDYVANLSENTDDKMWLETQVFLHRPPPKVCRYSQRGHRQWAKGAHPHRPLAALRGLVNGQRVLHTAAAVRLLRAPAGSGRKRYVLKFVHVPAAGKVGHTLAVDDVSVDDALRSYLAGFINNITLICSPLVQQKQQG